MRSDRSPKGYRLFVLVAAAFIALTLNSVPSAAQSYSHVRIVRLSFVEGTVTLHRPGVDEWAKVFINTPIQQGFKLATDANSFAEVEFENGSTVRLGQLSELDFTNLSLSPEGSKINHMTLARGYATFTVMPERGDVYEVQTAQSTYTATHKAVFRLDLQEDGQRLEVFKGNVGTQSPYGNRTIARNQVLQVIPASAEPFQITDGITEDAWDQWVNKRQQTETLASNRSGVANSSTRGSLYGWSDLSYFGNWTSLPGYGSCWAPMMGAGWSPYSVGRWSWYPGFGYTWISSLAWGWLPFHYGSWIYPAGTGWCWLPGNFSFWSPGLVTWYQGPGWVGWAPRTRVGGGLPAGCSSGGGCSTAVSFNTFQSGRPISPHDVVRVNAFHGQTVASPTVPLTRDLRLPGPIVNGVPLTSAMRRVARTSGASPLATSTNTTRMRFRYAGAAPTRVFSTGTVRGVWNVQPHAPSALAPKIHRVETSSGPVFHVLHGNGVHAGTVGRSGALMRNSPGRSTTSSPGRPTVNNDMLLPGRTAIKSPGTHSANHAAGLTSIPVSNLGSREGAIHRSSSLSPSARPSGNRVSMPSFPQQSTPSFHQNRFPARNRSMQTFHNPPSRSQEQMNRRFGASQSGIGRAPSSHLSSRGFGRGGMMSRPSGGMGDGMGGSMHGGSQPHSPHH